MFQPERVTLQNPTSWRIGKLRSLLSLLLLLAGVSPRLAAQASEWTWMGGSNTVNQPGVYGTKGVPAAGNVPGARVGAVSWTDSSGNFWLFGGQDNNGNFWNDLWKYTPSAGQWTWMSGSNAANQPGIYGTKGVPAAGNAPGGRYQGASWTDSSGNFWLFGGAGYDAKGLPGPLNDLWKYAPATGEWTWMSGSNAANQTSVYGTEGVPAAGNMPGGREAVVSWIDSSGNRWLFGGYDNVGIWNDLWRYAPSTGEWTWMSGTNAADQPGVYGTKGVPAAGNEPGAREGANSWMDSSGNLWLLGGFGIDEFGSGGYFNDLWKYTPSTDEWTWMSGSSTLDRPGVYGTLGLPAAGNVPGGRELAVSWMDASGNFWLFGGQGYSADSSAGTFGYLNDLWQYTPSTGEWTWMSGSNMLNQPGVYGALGVPAAGNVPGGRFWDVSWMDPSGNLWLFGGYGYSTNESQGHRNDLWEYNPTPPLPPSLTTPAPGSTLSGSTATFAWSNPGNFASRFVLQLSITAFGLSDVYSGAATTGTTQQVSGIPTNGAHLYATLWYYLYGKWQYSTATYTAAGTPTPPALTTPAPGSTLPGSTVTFGWNPGAGPTRYVLRLGTTGFGSMDVYSGAATTGTSVQVTTVPTNGAKLYATLWYYLNGNWHYANATFTEASH
jgi:N-acetylneuraminic acid mutarotase